ncbi:MAG: hypothetical protein WCH61_03860 [bacterium]
MSCDHYIQAWLQGKRTTELAHHLTTCPACAGFVAAHDRLLSVPIAAQPGPSPAVDRAVLTAARQHLRTTRLPTPLRPTWHLATWPRLAAAAGFAFLLAGAWWLKPVTAPQVVVSTAHSASPSWADRQLELELDLVAEQLVTANQTTTDLTGTTETAVGVEQRLNDCELNLLLLEEEETPVSDVIRTPLGGNGATRPIA